MQTSKVQQQFKNQSNQAVKFNSVDKQTHGFTMMGITWNDHVLHHFNKKSEQKMYSFYSCMTLLITLKHGVWQPFTHYVCSHWLRFEDRVFLCYYQEV